MDKERLFRFLDQKYLSRCELANKLPLGMDPEEVWKTVLDGRLAKAIRLPLKNAHGNHYWYVLTSRMITASEVIVEELMEHSAEQENCTVSVSTIEEIFFTSYMEGSQISIQDAMMFLQNGREAQDIEELMLLNNRQASSFAVQNMFHTIDEDYLHTLAYILTNGLDNGGGDFRLTDSIEIPSMRGEAYEVPCNSAIAGLTAEFTQFLADPKVHPLIKSAVSQAWVLTVRPFPEGNERLARLLSSVILIRAGYTFFSNVSLSALIARNGYSYFNAIANILRTENAADLTYFVEYYLTLLSSAVTELRTRRIQKKQEVYEAEKQMAQVPLGQPENAADDAVQISAQEKVKPKTNKNADKVKKAIQKLRKKGVNNIISSDIARETGISPKQAYRALEFLENEGYISCVRRTTGGNIYVFNSTESETVVCQDTDVSDKQSLVQELQKRTLSPKDSTSKIAGLLLDYIRTNKQSFTVAEIADTLGIDNITVRNVIIWFTRFNYIKTASHDGKCIHYVFAFNSDENSVEADSNLPAVVISDYSQETLNLLHELKTSTRSTKDRRLGEIITECLPRGIVTEADYIQRNEKSKWAIDMRFAVLLGLVEPVSRDVYRILPHLADARSELMYAQKSALSALYEFFSDDVFSVEMAVAKLEYSSSHVSGMLHQFTWLKLVDSQMNDDNTLSYHLKVNPKDDPECFLVA